MDVQVALLGFSNHRASLLRVVLTSTTMPGCRFTVVPAEASGPVDIAIVETDPEIPEPEIARLRQAQPGLVLVFVSEHGLAGSSRFRLDRKSLLARIRSVLDQIVREELSSEKVKTSGSSRWQTVSPPRPVLPAQGGAGALSQPPPAIPIAPSPVAPLLALIVDDSQVVRTQVKQGLERLRIRSHEAESAEQAMSLIERHWYDVAFFDVVMPGVDGYELCRRVKHDARVRRLPVMMLTSRSSPFDRARGALVGCDSYLTKPISWDAFYRAVDTTLNKAFKNDRSALLSRGYATDCG